MPLISELWGPSPNRVVALESRLSYGVAVSMARAAYFLGPFVLGSLLWETLSTFPADLHVSYHLLSTRTPLRGAWHTAMTQLAAFARAAALVFAALFVAYSHADPEIGCGSWPHALVAMSALAISGSVGCFVFKAMGIARIPPFVVGILGFFTLSQVAITLGSLAAWRGGLRPDGSACYLRIEKWFGIFSIFPLATLLFAFATLLLGHKHHQYRASLSTQRSSGRSSGSSRPAPMGQHRSTFGATGTTLYSAPDLSDPASTIKTESQANTQRMLDGPEQGFGPTSPTGPLPEAINVERSFLKLTGDGSSIGSSNERDDRAFLFFLQYGILTLVASLALLGGAIVAFMDFSPILPFSYQPVLVAVPVLCASRLGSLEFGPGTRRGSCLSCGSNPASRRGRDRNRILDPPKVHLGRGRPTSSGNSSDEKRLGGSQRAARFLSEKLSAQSLRARFRAFHGGTEEIPHSDWARDYDLHRRLEQRDIEISRPAPARSYSPFPTDAFLDATLMVRSRSDAPMRTNPSPPFSKLGFRSQRVLPYGLYGGAMSTHLSGGYSADSGTLSQGRPLPWNLPLAPLPAPRRKKASAASSNTSQRDSGGSTVTTSARRPQGGLSASVLTPPLEGDAFPEPEPRNSMQNHDLLQKRIQELWGVNAAMATSLSRADADRMRSKREDFSPRPISGRSNTALGQHSNEAEDAEEDSEIHFVPRGLSGLYSPPVDVEGLAPTLLEPEPADAQEQEQARRSSDIERKHNSQSDNGAQGRDSGPTQSGTALDKGPQSQAENGSSEPESHAADQREATASSQQSTPPTGAQIWFTTGDTGASTLPKRFSGGSNKQTLGQGFETHSDRGSIRSLTSRPIRGAASSANSAISIENVDEDDLKAVIDSRGFALDSKPALTKEDKFARALAQRASSPARSPATNGPTPPFGDSGSKLARMKAATTAGALRAGQPAMTDTTFGPAEVLVTPEGQEAKEALTSGTSNARDRLRRLESMGKAPRSNPFSSPTSRPRRPPRLSEDEERKPSDGSGNSGLSGPSAASAVTGPSNTTSSNDSSTDGGKSKVGSGSASGSGSGSGFSYGSTSYGAAGGFRRIGIGERGAAINLPGSGIGVSGRRKPAPSSEDSAVGRGVQLVTAASDPALRRTPGHGHRKAPSEQSGSSGGRSRASGNTFGGGDR